MKLAPIRRLRSGSFGHRSEFNDDIQTIYGLGVSNHLKKCVSHEIANTVAPICLACPHMKMRQEERSSLIRISRFLETTLECHLRRNKSSEVICPDETGLIRYESLSPHERGWDTPMPNPFSYRKMGDDKEIAEVLKLEGLNEDYKKIDREAEQRESNPAWSEF